MRVTAWAMAGRGAVVAAAATAGWLAAAAMPLVAMPAAGQQPGSGQQPAGRPTTADKADGAGGAEEREALRERLVRRIAELKSRAEILQQATRRLEQGESVETVREFIKEGGSVVAKLLLDPDAARELDRIGAELPQEGRGRGRGGMRGPGGPGDGPPGRERMPERGPLTDEEREVVREMLLATEPGIWNVLEKLHAENPGEADKRIMRMMPVAGPMVELRRRDPVLYRLRLEQMRYERQVYGVARQLVGFEGDPPKEQAEADRLHAELQVAAGRAFDLRIAVQAHELAKLQERLDKVRSDIAEQESQRESLIAHHVERVLEGMRKKPRRGRLERIDGPPEHLLPPGRTPGGDGERRRPATRPE